MALSIKGWLDLREPPTTEISETSYVRYDKIERISMIEGSSGEFHVLVHALGKSFLHSTHETMREAEITLSELVKSVG